MKKNYLFVFLALFLLTGCENHDEFQKNQYIAMKNHLLDELNYNVQSDLPVMIILKLDRQNQDVIEYRVLLKNPKENMHQLKMMVIHNYYTEDKFPSLGLFDNPKNLFQENNKEIELTGLIKTTKSISKLNLEFKIWIEYIDDNGEKKDIYYKTT